MTQQKSVIEKSNKPILTLRGNQAEKAVKESLWSIVTTDDKTGKITKVEYYLDRNDQEQALGEA